MEDQSSSAAGTTATTHSSVSISQNSVESISKSGFARGGAGLMCVVGQDGQTLILSDAEGRENIISGVTPDILQQVIDSFGKIKNYSLTDAKVHLISSSTLSLW